MLRILYYYQFSLHSLFFTLIDKTSLDSSTSYDSYCYSLLSLILLSLLLLPILSSLLLPTNYSGQRTTFEVMENLMFEIKIS